MLAVAAAGYRAVAPDCRGYGLSGQPPPPEHEEASWEDLVADVVAILDALAVPSAFVVGKDFGAMTAYDFAAWRASASPSVPSPSTSPPCPRASTSSGGAYVAAIISMA
ncbi:hypothetical protein ABZP36_030592 [Zizania latifolia]